MNPCKYCREYHLPYKVCDEYIESLKGKEVNEKKEFAEVEKVLDGADMNQDIHQLIGYCVSLGWTNKEMPSSHCSDLAKQFLFKYQLSKNVDCVKKQNVN